MKKPHIEFWVSINRLPPGRRVRALQRLRRVAAAHAMAPVVALCDAAIVEGKAQLELVRKAQMAPAAPIASWTPEILALDVRLDRILADLRELLVALARRPQSRAGQVATALLNEHFAQGLAWYTQATIDQEDVRVAGLVEALTRDAAGVAAVHADDVVADLVAVHAEYAEKVGEHDKALPSQTYAVFKASELAGHRALLEVVAEVLAATRALPEDERLARRGALLAEVAVQEAEVTEEIRARRRPTDVEPDKEGETA